MDGEPNPPINTFLAEKSLPNWRRLRLDPQSNFEMDAECEASLNAALRKEDHQLLSPLTLYTFDVEDGESETGFYPRAVATEAMNKAYDFPNRVGVFDADTCVLLQNIVMVDRGFRMEAQLNGLPKEELKVIAAAFPEKEMWFDVKTGTLATFEYEVPWGKPLPLSRVSFPDCRKTLPDEWYALAEKWGCFRLKAPLRLQQLNVIFITSDIGVMSPSEYLNARERAFAGEFSVTTGFDEYGNFFMKELGNTSHLGVLNELPEPLRDLRLEDLRPETIAK